MVGHEKPRSISLTEYHGIARRTRYLLAISNVGECVVTGVDRYVTVDPNVLFTKGDSCVRTLSGVLEVLGDGRWVRSNCLGGRAPKYGVRVVHCRDARRITTIVCGAPGSSCGRH